jgi:hypothetical protein
MGKTNSKERDRGQKNPKLIFDRDGSGELSITVKLKTSPAIDYILPTSRANHPMHDP